MTCVIQQHFTSKKRLACPSAGREPTLFLFNTYESNPISIHVFSSASKCGPLRGLSSFRSDKLSFIRSNPRRICEILTVPDVFNARNNRVTCIIITPTSPSDFICSRAAVIVFFISS